MQKVLINSKNNGFCNKVRMKKFDYEWKIPVSSFYSNQVNKLYFARLESTN